MKPVVIALSFLLAGARAAGADGATDELPQGVNYTPASAALTESATAKLRTALSGDAAALAPLLGLDSDFTVMVGPYFGLEINGDGLKGRNVLSVGRYHLPETPEQAELIVDSFRAKERAQKLLLAHYLYLMADFGGPLTIRAPNFDELALTWAWIAWDLDGPLLVVESAHDKYLFDFDPATGNIFWIERLTHPCFTGSQEGRQVLSCTCTSVARDAKAWSLRFEVQQSCPAPGLHQVAAVTATATGAARPSAYIGVSARTARVDAMLARRFGGSYSITALDVDTPGYQGPGKLLEGKPPVAPKDARGEPIHGYVLLGSAVGPDGRMSENRVLLSTDERASAAVLEAARSWRVEPPTRDGKPVTEIIWQELTL